MKSDMEVDVQVKIGVKHVAREIVIETNSTSNDVNSAVTEALNSGKPLSLTDEKGSVILIPIDSLAYLEIGSEEARRVGFGME